MRPRRLHLPPPEGSPLLARSLALLTLAAFAVAGASAPIASADPGDPVAHIETPPDGSYYPQGASEQFAFYCTSDTSFVVSCEGSQPLGSLIDTAKAGPHTLSVTATDFEGRQSTTTTTYNVIDITPPHVDFVTPSDGATYDLGANLTYDYSCADDAGGLGIAACSASLPPTAPLDTSRLGTFTFDVYAVDYGNNVTHATVKYTIADRTPPTITLTTPADGAIYALGQQVAASYTCDDGAGSGMNGCKGDTGSGAPLDTSTLGPKTFTVRAFDRAGNTSTVTHSYTVVYGFDGFFAPTAPYPNPTTAKAGETVQVRFSLTGDQGLEVFAANSPAWQPCGSLDSTRATGKLSYNRSQDRYTYAATTDKTWAGGCWNLLVTLRDGTVHKARFTFTK